MYIVHGDTLHQTHIKSFDLFFSFSLYLFFFGCRVWVRILFTILNSISSASHAMYILIYSDIEAISMYIVVLSIHQIARSNLLCVYKNMNATYIMYKSPEQPLQMTAKPNKTTFISGFSLEYFLLFYCIHVSYAPFGSLFIRKRLSISHTQVTTSSLFRKHI